MGSPKNSAVHVSETTTWFAAKESVTGNLKRRRVHVPQDSPDDESLTVGCRQLDAGDQRRHEAAMPPVPNPGVSTTVALDVADPCPSGMRHTSEPHLPAACDDVRTPLTCGARARICGLRMQPAQNGREGRLAEFRPDSSRWLIELDDVGTRLLIREANLEALPSKQQLPAMPDGDTSCDDGNVIRMDSRSVGDGSSGSAGEGESPSPCEEYGTGEAHGTGRLRLVLLNRLETLFVGERCRALECARDAVRAALERSAKCCTTGEQIAKESSATLALYHGLPAPSTYSELRERNSLRNTLEVATQLMQTAVDCVLDAFQQPTEELNTLRGAMLVEIDVAMGRLVRLREETLDLFDKAEATMSDESARHRKQAIETLAPCVRTMDEFVRTLEREVRAETAEAQKLFTVQLQRLEKEQSQFVRADASERNPCFTEVCLNIEALKEQEAERAEKDAVRAASLVNWNHLCHRLGITREDKKTAKDATAALRRRFRLW